MPPDITPLPAENPNRRFLARYHKAKMIIAAILVLGALAAAGLKSLLSLPPSVGSPLAQSVRAGNDIVTLIHSLEGYVPSLHRNPDTDRYSVALFVSPVDDPSHGRLIPIRSGFRSSELQLAHVIGYDGVNVWCALDHVEGINLRTGKLVDAANATPARGEREAGKSPFGLPVESFLSAGARPTPTKWLALLSTKDAGIHYKPKSLLDSINRPESAKEQRRFHLGALGPQLDKGSRAILSLTPLADNEYLNAAFVRSGPDAEPIRLSNPDGFLMVYTASPALGATLIVARVTTESKITWKADTGLERFTLKQILPDDHFPAFVGTRPPVSGKVPEPLLAVINTQSGEASARSLAQ